MIRALVFDFDGLMVDTEATSLRSWQDLYAEHDLELPLDLWVTLIGTWDAPFDPAKYLERAIGRQLSAEEHARRYAHEWTLASAQPLLPGVLEHLDAAARRGLALGVASSSSRRWVEGHLAGHGLRERFECVLTRDDVSRAKPDPELYSAALDCLGMDAELAIAFEDSTHGVTAATEAGMRCVAVPSSLTAASDFSRAVRVLDSLAAIDPEQLWDEVDGL